MDRKSSPFSGPGPVFANKQPIYISIGPQCSGKTTLLSQLQQRISKDPTQKIHDVTVDEQPGVYIPVDIEFFLLPISTTPLQISYLNRRILGKTIRSRLQEQVESTAVLQRLAGKVTQTQFESTITQLYRNHTQEALTRRNPTLTISDSIWKNDYHSHAATDLLQVVEEFHDQLAASQLLLPPQIQLFIVEALFRPDFHTSNQTAVEAASEQLLFLAKTIPSTDALAWGNTNTRPREYATALAAAMASGRPVYFLAYGDSTRRPKNNRNHNHIGVAKGVFALPKLEKIDLLRRNIQRLLETGKYVPAKGIWESADRVERLTETVLRDLDKEVMLRLQQQNQDDDDDTGESLTLPQLMHSKFDFDRRLVQLANYELLKDRTVRYVAPPGKRLSTN